MLFVTGTPIIHLLLPFLAPLLPLSVGYALIRHNVLGDRGGADAADVHRAGADRRAGRGDHRVARAARDRARCRFGEGRPLGRRGDRAAGADRAGRARLGPAVLRRDDAVPPDAAAARRRPRVEGQRRRDRSLDPGGGDALAADGARRGAGARRSRPAAAPPDRREPAHGRGDRGVDHRAALAPPPAGADALAGRPARRAEAGAEARGGAVHARGSRAARDHRQPGRGGAAQRRGVRGAARRCGASRPRSRATTSGSRSACWAPRCRTRSPTR